MNIIDRVKEVYSQNGWGDKLISFNGIPLPFDNTWKKIAIDLSGGADSALLTYVLATHIVTNNLDVEIHIISHIRGWNSKPWQEPISEIVFNKIVSMFPSIRFIRHQNYIPPEIEMGTIGTIIPTDDGMKAGCQIEAGSFAKYLLFTRDIDAKFGSTTKNPEHLSKEGVAGRNISTDELFFHKLVISNPQQKVTLLDPFIYFTKDILIKQYFENEIEDLLAVTRSCEGTGGWLKEAEEEEFNSGKITVKKPAGYYDDVKNNYKAGDVLPECGKCFWCLEKKWALSCV